MRLKYNILWFEDNEDYYNAANNDILEYLEDLGYIPNLERRPDDTNLIEEMQEKDVDLILVDYNLKGALKGDKLVEAIRKNELFTEAIFYAQNPPDLSKIKRYYEGVFYATRSDLIEKTKKIIDLTIKKNQDVSNIRGLFIAETVDMTRQMEEIISKILKLKKEPYAFFMGEIAQLQEFTDHSKLRVLNAYFRSLIAALSKEFEAMPSGQEREKLREEIESVSKIKSMLSKYTDEVIETRNSLAHGKPSDRKNCLIWKDKEIPYDEKRCKEIRKTFLKHSENLKKIMEMLDGTS
jgi:CheY-like chemotaxis protein